MAPVPTPVVIDLVYTEANALAVPTTATVFAWLQIPVTCSATVYSVEDPRVYEIVFGDIWNTGVTVQAVIV